MSNVCRQATITIMAPAHILRLCAITTTCWCHFHAVTARWLRLSNNRLLAYYRHRKLAQGEKLKLLVTTDGCLTIQDFRRISTEKPQSNHYYPLFIVVVPLEIFLPLLLKNRAATCCETSGTTQTHVYCTIIHILVPAAAQKHCIQIIEYSIFSRTIPAAVAIN